MVEGRGAGGGAEVEAAQRRLQQSRARYAAVLCEQCDERVMARVAGGFSD